MYLMSYTVSFSRPTKALIDLFAHSFIYPSIRPSTHPPASPFIPPFCKHLHTVMIHSAGRYKELPAF